MKCGVGAYTQRLAGALVEHTDIRVAVLTDEQALGAHDQEKVEVLPIVRGWRFVELARVVKHVWQWSPDIVHVQYPGQGYTEKTPKLIPLLMKLLGVHCVQTWHEAIVDKWGVLLSIGLSNLITVRKEIMTSVPVRIQKALVNTELSFIPAAALLPTISLIEEERAEIRKQYCSNGESLLAYYGFVAPLKGIESLFDIVEQTGSHLLMVCDFNPNDLYHKSLLEQISTMKLENRISIMGFLQDEELSRLLASADAVVLPFRDGALDCNTTIDGAVAQGTFVLTTSLFRSGYKKDKNIYYANPGNVDEMITALDKFSGRRIPSSQTASKWQNIACQHMKIYEQVMDS
jgi:glycosyltransferase involved in cell wall biosynthesis